jgi:hypothetical protein
MRAIGFGLELLLFVRSKKFLSSKGLYWACNKNNTTLSSYLATINGQPPVLDYVYRKDLSCDLLSCLFEQMNQDFGISAVFLKMAQFPMWE